MGAQRRRKLLRQKGQAVLPALPGPNNDGILRPLQVLDAKLEALVDAKARAVDKPGHEPAHALHCAEHFGDLVSAEDGGKPLLALRSNQAVEPAEGRAQNFAVQEDQGAERLGVRDRRDVRRDQGIEKALDVLLAKLLRVAFAVKEDVTPGPVHVGFGGARAVMALAAAPGNLVKEAGRADGLVRHGAPRGGGEGCRSVDQGKRAG